MFHVLDSVSGSLWRFSQPQPRGAQHGDQTLLHHPTLLRHPQPHMETGVAGKCFPGGCAGPGTKGNLLLGIAEFFISQDPGFHPKIIHHSRERGMSVGDGSTAEVTPAILALPQPRDKRFLLFTPRTLDNICSTALNALVKTFSHIHCLPKCK